MTQKANAKQQSTVTLFRGERHVGGRAAVAAPALRRSFRHPSHLLADAILVLASDDVNLNILAAGDDLTGVTPEVNLIAVPFMTGVEVFSKRREDSGVRRAAGLDDEDEEDDDFDDDDLDEDDDEDLDDEDDEDFEDEDDLEDEDDDLDDDDLDDEEEDEDDE